MRSAVHSVTLLLNQPLFANNMIKNNASCYWMSNIRQRGWVCYHSKTIVSNLDNVECKLCNDIDTDGVFDQVISVYRCWGFLLLPWCYHHSKRTRLIPLLEKDKGFLFLSQKQVIAPKARQGRQGFKYVGVGRPERKLCNQLFIE